MAAKTRNDRDYKMPLLDHIVELRRRLLYSVVAFLVAFLICFYFANPLFNFLVEPLRDLFEGEEGRRLIFTALHEKFFTNVKVAFFAAGMLAFPIIAVQIWIFVAPGLYRNEKRAFLPFLVVTPILFLTGAAMVYYIVMPVAWQFFASFQTLGQVEIGNELPVELLPRVSEYLSLSMRLIFAFGLAFGFAFGFAFKDMLSNFISGILIFIYEPFSLGDVIEVDGKKGKVLNGLKGKQIVLDYIVLSRSGTTQN